ncbi:N,N-dimethylformamidase beta subunit family domain-containing protein [Actinoplanes sp. L3-i22]|uniref:N,N-dimethylformamidase beta subunit family domain-containing protein n=1 Tax=Actinoplanes sp. L3-i22 TaxID=2836373 RepID=UPI001C74B1B5|nr:N,N-dimethylformamidase beta subunit family domain-containing protein [Actinoplanes sp. L3-i22]BCY07974.1 hypothetical protein L3i22_030620 [Actinoplanes sp. L3-i22]
MFSSRAARRSFLGTLAFGATALAAGLSVARKKPTQRRWPDRSSISPTILENRAEGDGGWRPNETVKDRAREIQGYASTTSVNAGEWIDFHIAVADAQPFTVTLHRIGHYDGAGGRIMHSTGELTGSPQPLPEIDPETGMMDCRWPATWTFQIPEDWASGLFLATFATRDGLHRASTPFVVRNDDRRPEFLVVVPFTTYAAYNTWPLDGVHGKSLYKGYRPDGSLGGLPERAHRVSFNRPFFNGGRPTWFALDVAAAQWIESHDYDVGYVTSVDLHEGRVDPARHRALVFSGHDEYWSPAMRQVVETAIRDETHCAFLTANNVYWNIRLDADPQGVPGRVVTCYKGAPDPAPEEPGPTVLWRSVGHRRKHAEARLLGVAYNGILRQPVPLVVSKADHWFWSGTGVRDGEEIRDLVAVEADGWWPALPTDYESAQTLLSRSPYQDKLGRGYQIQHTSLCETPKKTIMFVAGTFHWPLALAESKYTDPRIQQATKNLFDRFRKST